MGLHLDGNRASVDPRGFVVDVDEENEGTRGHVLTRILGHPAVRGVEDWSQGG